MKLSCSTGMVPGNNLTEQALQLKEWGYDGIAVFADYETWNVDKYRELLTLEERTGIVPCEFAFSSPIYGHLMDEDLKLQKSCREMYRLAVEISGELGAVTELEFSYGPQNPLPLFQPYRKMSRKQEENFLNLYRELLEPLKGTKGKLLLEGINRYESPFLNSIKDCKDFIEQLHSENAGVLADFFHMSIEEGSITESLIYAGKTVKHVHLGDNNRLLPGYGSTDWDVCFTTLEKIGFHGYVNLECSTCGKAEETLPKTAAFLREKIWGGRKGK